MASDSSLRALIAKYSGAGPRYTSYPTAAQFHDRFSEQDWISALRHCAQQSNGSLPLSLYVHVPFCHELCYFCACSKTIPRNRDVVPPFLRAVSQEIEHYHSLLSTGVSPQVHQLHFGGGSPNYLTPDELASVVQRLFDTFGREGQDPDYSIELDPRTTTPEQLTRIRELGFNRMSLGVQDFDPLVQETINRLQSIEQTAQLCQAARELGFGGINIDLVYGLPNQNLDGFARTLAAVVQLRPNRIALYGYAHVPWMTKVQNVFAKAKLPSPDERLLLLLHGIDTLERAGYVHLGMDHFALPDDSLTQAAMAGEMHRNFMGYTTHRGTMLLGFGPSAISSCAEAMAQNARSLDSYQGALNAGRLAIDRGIVRSADDQIRGEVIQRILCDRRLDLRHLSVLFNLDLEHYFSAEMEMLEGFEQDAIVERTATGFEVTATGKFFLRNVAMVFDVWNRPASVGVAEKPRYSQMV